MAAATRRTAMDETGSESARLARFAKSVGVRTFVLGIYIAGTKALVVTEFLRCVGMNTETPSKRRKLTVEVVGTLLAMACGVVLGMLLPGKGEGVVTDGIVCGLVAWLFWTRRRENLARTFAIAIGMAIILWPITFVLLDWLHPYY